MRPGEAFQFQPRDAASFLVVGKDDREARGVGATPDRLSGGEGGEGPGRGDRECPCSGLLCVENRDVGDGETDRCGDCGRECLGDFHEALRETL